MKQFYTCWVEDTNGGYGCKHSTHKAAKAEAERLANLSAKNGKKVYVLCCLGFASINRVIWEDTTINDTLPF